MATQDSSPVTGLAQKDVCTISFGLSSMMARYKASGTIAELMNLAQEHQSRKFHGVFVMRTIGITLLAITLFVSSVSEAMVSNAPLAPGKPAELKEVQADRNGRIWGLGIAIVAGSASLVTYGNGSRTVTTMTATTP